jgi:Sulfate permease and related transporters (MFS superfamily)
MVLKKFWKLLGVFTAIVVGSNAIFLPGPSFLVWIFYPIHLLSQLAAIFCILSLPLALIVLAIMLYERKRFGPKIPTAVCVITICAAISVSFFAGQYFSDIGRYIAMRNAKDVIRFVETKKPVLGPYPDHVDLSAYSPGVIGVQSYKYERKANGYEVSFAQNVLIGFNFEVVVYNPLDQHIAEGEMRELYDTPCKHWRYYIYD